MSITVEIRGEYIQLDQLLKTTGLCHSGGYAHAEIEAGNVLVDGAVETRKRAKLRPGQHLRRGHAFLRGNGGKGGNHQRKAALPVVEQGQLGGAVGVLHSLDHLKPHALGAGGKEDAAGRIHF